MGQIHKEDSLGIRSDGKRGATERASLSTPFYKRIDGGYGMRSRSDHEKATRFLEDDFDIRSDGKRGVAEKASLSTPFYKRIDGGETNYGSLVSSGGILGVPGPYSKTACHGS